MPIVHVSFIEGPDADAKRRLIGDLTRAVVADLDVPAEAVSVVLAEVPASHWGVGGTPLAETLGRMSGGDARGGT